MGRNTRASNISIDCGSEGWKESGRSQCGSLRWGLRLWSASFAPNHCGAYTNVLSERSRRKASPSILGCDAVRTYYRQQLMSGAPPIHPAIFLEGHISSKCSFHPKLEA
jgi:hypothetical protein